MTTLPYLSDTTREKSPYSNKSVRKWTPTLYPPVEGQLSRTVNELTNAFLTELTNCNKDLKNYRVMHKKDPTARACIELKCLRANLAIGTYQHKNPRIEEWVKANFDGMQGSLNRITGRLAGACAEGMRMAEIVFSNKMPGYKNQWRLKGFNLLDSEKITFEGKDGEIDWVVYLDGTGNKIRIPYWKCIHIVNGFGTLHSDQDSVFGDPESRAAYPYFKAKQAILTEMMVAAKSNAMGIWVGKADSNVTVEVLNSDGSPQLNPDGSPRTESAVTALLRQLRNVENNSIIVTDKNNEVQPLSVQTSEGFWNLANEMLDKGIRRAYGVPDLIFSEGSSSLQFGSLGKQHESVMDSAINSLVVQIQDQLIEKAIRPLLVFNFGVGSDFGSFERTANLDPEQSSVKIQNIISAIQSQAIAPTNLNATNALYELLGLPSITQEEQSLEMQRALMKAYYDNAVLMGTPIPGITPASAPPPEGTEEEPAESVSEE